MPILANGMFTVRVPRPGSAFLRSKPIQFDYAPVSLVWWALLAAVCGLAIFYSDRGNRRYSAARYLVLVPGMIGVAVVFALDTEIAVIASLPLQTVTAAFILWRALRARQWWLAMILAYVAGMIVTGHNLVAGTALIDGSSPVILVFIQAAICSVFIGAAAGYPTIAVRVAVRDRVTPHRLAAGALIGFGLPFVGVAVCIALYALLAEPEKPTWPGHLYNLFCWASPVVLLFALIRWNSWARDVATGSRFSQPAG